MLLNHQNKSYELIFKTKSGSHLYGTAYYKGENPLNPDYESDQDFRGVFIADWRNKLGLEEIPDHIKPDDNFDTELYELRKFFKLAIDNNPNIIDILFADKESIVYCNDKGKKILENRHLFLSQKIKDKFCNYALSQLKRMSGHHKWIQKYPAVYEVIHTIKKAYEAEAVDFHWIANYISGALARYITKEADRSNKKLAETLALEEMSKQFWPAHHQDMLAYFKPHVLSYLFKKDVKLHKYPLEDNVIDFLQNHASLRRLSETALIIYDGGNGIFTNSGQLIEDCQNVGEFQFFLSFDQLGYKHALKETRDLWYWVTKRNPERARYEEQIGYDCKHGMHLIRLLIAAKNIYNTGNHSPRLMGDDLALCRSIRAGELSYDAVVALSDNLLKEVERLAISSSLPKLANFDKINHLLIDLSCV